jgi:Ca2+-binding EF-hand superfamily protein
MNALKVFTATFCLGLLVGGSAQTHVSTEEGNVSQQLIEKYDANGNGKIDVEERKGYVRERARLLREEARRDAALRPVIPPELRPFVVLPNWTKEKVTRYDVNRNGKLDAEERRQERLDAIQAARAQFRKADTNGDGRLSSEEHEASLATKR